MIPNSGQRPSPKPDPATQPAETDKARSYTTPWDTIVGEERSLNEWRLGRAWGGKPMDWRCAQGILVAALEVLSSLYGMQKRVDAFAQ